MQIIILDNLKDFWSDLKVSSDGRNLLKNFPKLIEHFPGGLEGEALYGTIGLLAGLLLMILGLSFLASSFIGELIIFLLLLILLTHVILSFYIYSKVMYSKNDAVWKKKNAINSYIPIYGIVVYFFEVKKEV